MHEIWAGWARYMIDTHCLWQRQKWERQIATPYADLSEKEKESDRIEAHKILSFLEK